MTYNDKTITYSGDLASYDYDAILRDKQRNINSLYELADYYVDADPIFRGIIKGVYVPFSLSDDFRLVGANEQTKAKYLEYYDRIHLKDRMRSIFYQYFKYGNVYCYLMEDGNIITLPVHLVRIANVMIGGEPVPYGKRASFPRARCCRCTATIWIRSWSGRSMNSRWNPLWVRLTHRKTRINPPESRAALRWTIPSAAPTRPRA